MSALVLEGTLSPGDLAGRSYVALPFAVPPGTSRIDVRYRHDEGPILDLGLLDALAGPFPSERGFRGWSGSARREVYVARDAATPGYLAGPIPAGTWHVLLGLARLGPAPCRYRVDIELDASPRPPRDRAEPSTVSVGGRRWYKGDLHTHTYFSDARGSMGDIVAAARARGLDYLSVTDHNTTGHHAAAREASSAALVVVPGEEITTYHGHANVWGVAGWVDFRLGGPADVERLVGHVHGRGGLFAVNHPRTAPNCIGCDWEYPVPDAVDAFEAWNGPWAYRNWEALERYDALLRRGLRPTLVGGSDRHQPPWPDADPELLRVGSPTTWFLLDELSEATLLAGLRGGNAFVSEGPSGPQLELEVGGAPMGSAVRAPPGAPLEVRAAVRGAGGSLLRYVGASGVLRETRVTRASFTDVWRWNASGPFLRAEILAQDDEPQVTQAFEALYALGKIPAGLTLQEVLARPRRRALSNPVYVEGAGRRG